MAVPTVQNTENNPETTDTNIFLQNSIYGMRYFDN